MSLDSDINTIKLVVRGLRSINDGYVICCIYDDDEVVEVHITLKDIKYDFDLDGTECFLKLFKVDGLNYSMRSLSENIIYLRVDKEFNIIYEKEGDDGPSIMNDVFEVNFWGPDPFKPSCYFYINFDLFES